MHCIPSVLSSSPRSHTKTASIAAAGKDSENKLSRVQFNSRREHLARWSFVIGHKDNDGSVDWLCGDYHVAVVMPY